MACKILHYLDEYNKWLSEGKIDPEVVKIINTTLDRYRSNNKALKIGVVDDKLQFILLDKQKGSAFILDKFDTSGDIRKAAEKINALIDTEEAKIAEHLKNNVIKYNSPDIHSSSSLRKITPDISKLHNSPVLAMWKFSTNVMPVPSVSEVSALIKKFHESINNNKSISKKLPVLNKVIDTLYNSKDTVYVDNDGFSKIIGFIQNKDKFGIVLQSLVDDKYAINVGGVAKYANLHKGEKGVISFSSLKEVNDYIANNFTEVKDNKVGINTYPIDILRYINKISESDNSYFPKLAIDNGSNAVSVVDLNKLSPKISKPSTLSSNTLIDLIFNIISTKPVNIQRYTDVIRGYVKEFVTQELDRIQEGEKAKRYNKGSFTEDLSSNNLFEGSAGDFEESRGANLNVTSTLKSNISKPLLERILPEGIGNQITSIVSEYSKSGHIPERFDKDIMDTLQMLVDMSKSPEKRDILVNLLKSPKRLDAFTNFLTKIALSTFTPKTLEYQFGFDTGSVVNDRIVNLNNLPIRSLLEAISVDNIKNFFDQKVGNIKQDSIAYHNLDIAKVKDISDRAIALALSKLYKDNLEVDTNVDDRPLIDKIKDITKNPELTNIQKRDAIIKLASPFNRLILKFLADNLTNFSDNKLFDNNNIARLSQLLLHIENPSSGLSPYVTYLFDSPKKILQIVDWHKDELKRLGFNREIVDFEAYYNIQKSGAKYVKDTNAGFIVIDIPINNIKEVAAVLHSKQKLSLGELATGYTDSLTFILPIYEILQGRSIHQITPIHASAFGNLINSHLSAVLGKTLKYTQNLYDNDLKSVNLVINNSLSILKSADANSSKKYRALKNIWSLVYQGLTTQGRNEFSKRGVNDDVLTFKKELVDGSVRLKVTIDFNDGEISPISVTSSFNIEGLRDILNNKAIAEHLSKFITSSNNKSVSDLPTYKFNDSQFSSIISDKGLSALHQFYGTSDPVRIAGYNILSKIIDMAYDKQTDKYHISGNETDFETIYNNQTNSSIGDLVNIYGRSYISDAQSLPNTLSNPIKFIGLARELVAKVLGNDVGIVFESANSKVISQIEAKLGKSIIGFSTVLADKKVLGVVLDRAVSDKDAIVTIGHELYHLVEPQLPKADYNLLMAKYKNVEAIAEAFGNYIADKYNPPSFARRVFDTMLNILNRIANLFRGLGFNSVSDVFHRIEAGDYATKSPTEIPFSHFMEAWDIAKKSNSIDELIWNSAFRTKVAESEKAISTKLKELWNDTKPFIKYGHNIFKNTFVTPIFSKSLAWAAALGRESVMRVNHAVTPSLQVTLNEFKNLQATNPQLFDVLNKLIIHSDIVGKHYANIKEALQEIKNPISKTSDISQLKKAYDTYKLFTDTVKIVELRQYFDMIFFNTHQNIANKSEDFKWFNNILDDIALFKEVVLDIDTSLVDNKFRYSIEERYNLFKDIQNRVILKLLYLYTNPEFIAQGELLLKKHRGNYNAIIDGLTDLAVQYKLPTEPLRHVYNIIDAMSSIAETLKLLDGGFYFPRVRNNGNYEARLFTKYELPDGKIKYVEIGYFDTKAGRLDPLQQKELDSIVKNLQSNYNISDKYVLSTSESYVDAISFEDVIKSNFGDVPNFVIFKGSKAPKDLNFIYAHSPTELLTFISDIVTKVDSTEQKDQLSNVLSSAIIKMYADIMSSVARKQARARLPKGVNTLAIEGYSTDLIKVITDYGNSMLGHLSNADFLNRYLTITKSNEFQQYKHDNIESYNLIKKYVNMVTAPTTNLAKAVYRVRAGIAIYYLGMRLTTALLNSANFITTFIPEYTTVKSLPTIESLKVLYDPTISSLLNKTPAKWGDEYRGSMLSDIKSDLSNSLTFLKDIIQRGYYKPLDITVDHDKLLQLKQQLKSNPTDYELKRKVFILEGLEYLGHMNAIESSFAKTIKEEGMNLFGSFINKGLDSMMLPFKLVENYSRTVSAIMTLNELYKKIPDDNPQHLIHAVKITGGLLSKTYFDYGRLNRYWWTNPTKPFGALFSLSTTLKGFTANYWSLLHHWAEERQWKKMAMSLSALTALGGISALPGIDDLLSIFEKASGYPIRLTSKQLAKKEIGLDAYNVLIKGLPTLLGVDLSKSLKVEIPFLPKGFAFDDLTDILLGIHKDTYGRITEGFKDLSDEDYLNGLIHLMPYGIGMPLEALKLSTTGLTTKSGKTVYTPDGKPMTITPGEALLKTLGGNPITLSDYSDDKYLIKSLNRAFEEERQRIYKKYRTNKLTQELWLDIIEFNKQAVKYHIPKITLQGLHKTKQPAEKALNLQRVELLGS